MIKEKLNDDMKAAMRAHDTARLGTIRLLRSEIKQREIDNQIVAGDDEVLAIITKMVKQRRDSVDQYVKGGRQDLADKEQAEIDVLSEYLPKPLTDDELAAIIDKAVADSGAAGMAGMGKVMALVRPQVNGRADMGKVSQLVKAKLTA